MAKPPIPHNDVNDEPTEARADFAGPISPLARPAGSVLDPFQGGGAPNRAGPNPALLQALRNASPQPNFVPPGTMPQDGHDNPIRGDGPAMPLVHSNGMPARVPLSPPPAAAPVAPPAPAQFSSEQLAAGRNTPALADVPYEEILRQFQSQAR